MSYLCAISELSVIIGELSVFLDNSFNYKFTMGELEIGKQMPKRAELHNHLGGAVDPPIMWSIAHNQGIKLPSKDYWDFEDLITIGRHEQYNSVKEIDQKFYYWTELIQSSPYAIETSVKSVIGGGYRKCNIVVHELRFCPMKRNRGGEQDLDHIITAAIRGMDRAILEYPQVKAGLILMMDRSLTYQQNKIIIEKAVKYKHKGIVGIDLAGPQKKNFKMKAHLDLFKKAKKAGLGVTIHTGEEGRLTEMKFVVDYIKPQRIGHGILAWQDKELMKKLVKQKITLEICPTSNLKSGVADSLNHLKKMIQTLYQYKVSLTINTDGPEMYKTNVYKEQQLLINQKILTKAEVSQCFKNGFRASFVK